MRRRPGFWIALILFVGLAAYIRYFESRRSTEEKGEEPFLAVEPTAVSAITASWVDTIRIEKKDGAWVIVSPAPFPADPYAVEALLSRIRSLQVIRRFSVEPEELGRYGLERPRATVELELTDGSSTRLLIGAPAPASPAFYVQVAGRPEVGLLSDNEVDSYFRKEKDGWRRRNLLDPGPGEIVGLDLETAASRVRLERLPDGHRWTMIEPFPGPADAGTVEEFVKGLLAMKARSYPEDHPGALAPYGLDRPPGRIIVFRSEGDPDTLEVGGTFTPPHGLTERYARSTDMTGIIGVPTGYLGVAGRSHVVFREARLFTMPLSAGRSLTVSAGGRSARLEPDSAGVWRLAGEASTPGVPPPDRTAFARDWMTVRADSVAAARGPAPPPGASRLDVIVEGPKGPERIVVTDPVMAGDNELWPAHLIQSDPPRPGEVFLLDAGLVRETLALLARE